MKGGGRGTLQSQTCNVKLNAEVSKTKIFVRKIRPKPVNQSTKSLSLSVSPQDIADPGLFPSVSCPTPQIAMSRYFSSTSDNSRHIAANDVAQGG